MGKNQINVALLGLGRIGQMHAENLINHKSFNLKYTFDISKKLAKNISRKFNTVNISTPEKAFRDKNIDLIFIASVSYTHLTLPTKA